MKPIKENIPSAYILKVIQLIRESFDGAVQVYNHGSCAKLAMLLKYLFPEGTIYSNINHTIFKYDDKFYDINGIVYSHEGYIPIIEYGEVMMFELLSNKYEKSI